MKRGEIINFCQERLTRRNPNEDGIYLTVRCGLTGVYKMINVWQDNKWQIEVLDDSITLARSEKPLTDDEIVYWKGQRK